VIRKGSDIGVYHSELSDSCTVSITWYSKITRELNILETGSVFILR
jgi:hypothetical protein